MHGLALRSAAARHRGSYSDPESEQKRNSRHVYVDAYRILWQRRAGTQRAGKADSEMKVCFESECESG